MGSLENALAGGWSRQELAAELWRRSAIAFLAAGELNKSGEAWLKAGDKKRAAELFAEAGNNLKAAELFFDCNCFAEALICAERCDESAAAADFYMLVAARLVAAAARSRLGDEKKSTDLLRTVRTALAGFDVDREPFTAAKAWESLARFGSRAGRPDLIRLGYEKALAVYGLKFNLQRLRAACDYLEAVAGDHLLEAEINGRIEQYRQAFTDTSDK